VRSSTHCHIFFAPLPPTHSPNTLPQSFLAALNEPRTAHLEEGDKQLVAGECQSALDWLAEKEGLQKKLAKVNSVAKMGGACLLACLLGNVSCSWACHAPTLLQAAPLQLFPAQAAWQPSDVPPSLTCPLPPLFLPAAVRRPHAAGV
jgi:hypothetical protein